MLRSTASHLKSSKGGPSRAREVLQANVRLRKEMPETSDVYLYTVLYNKKLNMCSIYMIQHLKVALDHLLLQVDL